MEHLIAAVSFLGSPPIVKYVHALGGAKNHAVVLSDAGLDLAANLSRWPRRATV